MKILIDIGHPAHVHLFKNFAWEMQKRGHFILFTTREKEFEIYLLEKYSFNYVSFGKKYKTLARKIVGLLKFDFLEILHGMKFKPDIFLSHGSVYAAHASLILRKPHISLEDTFNFEQIRLYKPFTDAILTSDYEHPIKDQKVIKYSGYHELAYLHPKIFHPDKRIKSELNLKNDEKYLIIRFVAWSATHDIGQQGISAENKYRIVKELSNIVKVFVSSEDALPRDLSGYKFPLPAHKMHDALSYATMIFCESGTMVSEGAMLGIPGIYIDNKGRFYTNEQEKKYKLVYNYKATEDDVSKALNKAIELLKEPNLKQKWQQRRNKMILEKIDVTAFLVWFIENWPVSFKIMKKNPPYQERFKSNFDKINSKDLKQ